MVDSNSLTGTIPNETVNLISLQHLWLERNNFSGHLMPLSELLELKVLHVHDNHFSGSVESICPLFRLELIEFQADCGTINGSCMSHIDCY
jgi:hypothetical protein